MRAVMYEKALRLDTTVPKPEPTSEQSLLKIRRAGICNTDLELMAGYKEFSGILGHEFVAEVVGGELAGRRVVGEINVTDGTCEMCQRGIPSQCLNRNAIGIDDHPGAFADYLALVSRNLYPVPDDVSDDMAVFVEPLAAALQVTEGVHISPRDRVVLIGAGKLGLLVAQVLKLTGADLSVVARREKPAALLQKWGIRAVTADELSRRSAQVVVDCTGNAEGFAQALELVQPRGTIVLKSTYVGTPAANLTRVAVDEIRVVGSRCGPFDAALRLLSHGLIDTESMIDGRYSIDAALVAFDHAAKPGALKVLLEF